MLTNRIGNISFHGMLSTAWPWPYAPQGLPELTIQMGRPDPFDPNDGCGDGTVAVHPDGLVDKVYNLWNRNPMTVSAHVHDVERQGRTAPREPKLDELLSMSQEETRDMRARVIRTGAVVLGARERRAPLAQPRGSQRARTRGAALRRQDQGDGRRRRAADAASRARRSPTS